MKMLIIDDSPSMRAIIEQLGRQLSFKTEQAGDGLEAMAKLINCPRQEPFDLAIIDWEMPGMAGLEFVSAVRKNPEHDSVKMMMVTGRNKQEEVSRALEAGADEYLMKPITRETFSEKLQILGFVN
jgi:two-component system chemotaxis response regulator CheY